MSPEISNPNQHRKVLILCTGNSCRSQMAESLINSMLASKWQAFSAGTKPSGYVHPKAIKALAELGIHHQGVSKHTDQFKDTDFDLVITVCDSAAEECPIWLGKGRRIHIGFPDPAEVTGTEEEIMSIFRQVRDDIAGKILTYLDQYQA